MALYPLIIDKILPPYYTTYRNFSIPFELSPATSVDEIQHIQVYITSKYNNRSIAKTSLYPDGVIYKDFNNNKDPLGKYHVLIDTNDLIDGTWRRGETYKVQIRFGKNKKFASIENFVNWKNDQISQGAFSEWSIVSIFKVIDKPSVFIKNGQNNEGGENVEQSLSPTFYGEYNINVENQEDISKYRFILYDKSMNLIEDSGWLNHRKTYYEQDVLIAQDQYQFKTYLQNKNEYVVTYKVITVNGLQVSAGVPYGFLVLENYINQIQGVILKADDFDTFCLENGCIKLFLTSKMPLTGNYILTRSSEESDYKYWEDIKFFLFNEKIFYNELFYIDYLIESGKRYKYALQKINSRGVRTSPLIEEGGTPHMVYFQYSYLNGNHQQLCLKFNNVISSYRRVVMEQKQDSIGGRYPLFFRNKNTCYDEFQISGVISALMDINSCFSKHLYSEDDPYENMSDSTVYREKQFREQVIAFLNDGKPKVYKSPTEGNKIIILSNVNFTPKNELFKMIYDFSATATEIASFNINSLINSHIMEVGEYIPYQTKIGSVLDQLVINNTGSNIDLLEAIKQKVEKNDAKEKVTFESLQSIEIEIQKGNQLPTLTMNGEPIFIKENVRFYFDQDVPINSLLLKGQSGSVAIIDFIVMVKHEYKEEDITVTSSTYHKVYNQLNGTFSDSLRSSDHSQDIMQEIKNAVKREVEQMYSITFDHYDGNTDEWSNSAQGVYYNFLELTSLTIEAEVGTVFTVNGREYLINETEYFNLEDPASIKNLTFLGTSYAIVDYKAKILIQKKEVAI